MRFPQTLFARAFLLIVVLILLSLSSALAIFRYVQQEPRAQQMAQMVVAVVNLTRAAMLSAAPEWHSALLAELGDAEGLRVSMADCNTSFGSAMLTRNPSASRRMEFDDAKSARPFGR
jgi:two-component system osmolarity sensor histidine kinase EnvZ